MTTEDPNRRRGRLRRRSVLRTVGGALAAGTSGAVAGCLSSLPTMGQRIRYAEVDVPDAGDPSYRKWIPASIEAEGYEWGDWPDVYITPGVLDDTRVNARSLLSMPESLTRPFLDYVGVGFENYDEVVRVGPVIVALGSFDSADVREAVLEMGYEANGGTDEYDRFVRTNPEATLAVMEGVVLFGREPDSWPAVSAVIDAGTGRRNRLHEVDEAVDEVTRRVGSQPGIWFTGEGMGGDRYGLEGDRETVHSALATTYDRTAVYHHVVGVFEDDIDLSEQRVRQRLENDEDAIRASRVDVTVEDGTVDVAFAQPIDELSWYDETATSPPQITWWFEERPDRDAISIEHRGGEAVDASELELVLHDRGWAAPEIDRQFDDRYAVVRAGDTLTVDVGDRTGEATLTIVHSPDGDDSTAPVGRYSFD